MDAKVSIIIPAFNAASFITRALASIEGQTLKPEEVVVIDDGSTDETSNRVNEFTRTSTLKIIFAHQSNQGSAAARNHGVRKSSGDLIAFLDADDLIYPQFLEQTTLGLARYPHWSACFTNLDVVDMSGALIAKDQDNPVFQAIKKKDMGDGFTELSDDALFSKMLMGSVIPMTTVFRRPMVEAIQGFDETLRFSEDRLFFLQLIKRGGIIGYVNRALGIWQRHEMNKTGVAYTLQNHQYSDIILAKIMDRKETLELSQTEVGDIRSAQCRQAVRWIYAASSVGSNITLPLGCRLMFERRITLGCFLKSLARYSMASLGNPGSRLLPKKRAAISGFSALANQHAMRKEPDSNLPGSDKWHG